MVAQMDDLMDSYLDSSNGIIAMRQKTLTTSRAKSKTKAIN